MPPARKAPNRPLDLAELEQMPYREVLQALEALRDAHPALYLHPSKRWEYPWALERAGLPAPSTLLDVGSGQSILPLYLHQQGHAVTACDWVVEPAVRPFIQPGLQYMRGDMCALGLQAERFDAVFCISAIEHLAPHHIARALGELHRVLRPGGALMLTTDYYEDTQTQLFYEGPDRRFAVDWHVFDADALRRHILEAPGWDLDGEIDLEVDWDCARTQMRAYHGYPYTSIGVRLLKR